MSNINNKFGVVILAAGIGKRMKTGIPKVLNKLRGQPLIDYVVAAVEKSGLGEKPVIVVPANHTEVQDYLAARARYAVQEKQLGTAHAAACGEVLLRGKVEHLLILYGDMPFFSDASIRLLADEHLASGSFVTIATSIVPDFKGYRAALNDFGRVVRDNAGEIVKIVEVKDATPAEAAVQELNTGSFCFRAEWFWEHVKDLKAENAQKEYYLTDLAEMALRQGKKVSSITIDDKEAIGINSKEQLAIAEKL